jgi:hypothetical protein
MPDQRHLLLDRADKPEHWVVSIADSSRRRYAPAALVAAPFSPRLSPDGRWLLHLTPIYGPLLPSPSAPHHARARNWLIITDLQNGRSRRVSNERGLYFVGSAPWSPNGASFTFTRRRFLQASGGRIYVAGPDGRLQLVAEGARDAGAWSPEGLQLAFISDPRARFASPPWTEARRHGRSRSRVAYLRGDQAVDPRDAQGRRALATTTCPAGTQRWPGATATARPRSIRAEPHLADLHVRTLQGRLLDHGRLRLSRDEDPEPRRLLLVRRVLLRPRLVDSSTGQFASAAVGGNPRPATHLVRRGRPGGALRDFPRRVFVQARQLDRRTAFTRRAGRRLYRLNVAALRGHKVYSPPNVMCGWLKLLTASRAQRSRGRRLTHGSRPPSRKAGVGAAQ